MKQLIPTSSFVSHGIIWTHMSMSFQKPCNMKLTFQNRKGLDVQQAAFAVRLYKSHCRVGVIGDMMRAIGVQENHTETMLALQGSLATSTAT
jgi:hypothetical protein